MFPNLKPQNPFQHRVEQDLTSVGLQNVLFLVNITLNSQRLSFAEAAAVRFTIGVMDGPFRVGQPFSIPVEFYDGYGNLTKPSKETQPKLSARSVHTQYKELGCLSVACVSFYASSTTGETTQELSKLRCKCYNEGNFALRE